MLTLAVICYKIDFAELMRRRRLCRAVLRLFLPV